MVGPSLFAAWDGGYTRDRPKPRRYRVLALPVQPSVSLPAQNGEPGVHIVSRSGRYSCVSWCLPLVTAIIMMYTEYSRDVRERQADADLRVQGRWFQAAIHCYR